MMRLTVALAAAATLALAACGSAEQTTATAADPMADRTANSDMAPTENLVEIAQGNSDFSILVEAVQAAGLVETLSGSGPYTIFAPTNAAFDSIPQATRDELMGEAGQSDLADIVRYHAVRGRVDGATLMRDIEAAGEEGYAIDTLGGGTLTATLEDGDVVLRDGGGTAATVTQTDLDATNGIVHAIDAVLMPS